MNKTEKRMKIFALIMQMIMQAVLLFPWMNMGTWKCNAPGYLIKLCASGNKCDRCKADRFLAGRKKDAGRGQSQRADI